MNYIRLGQAISRAKVSRCGDNDYPVLSITMKDGIVMQSDKFKKRIASKDISEYKVIPAGLLVQGIHMDEGNFGIQDIVSYGIVSPAYTAWAVDESVVFPKYIEMVLRSPRCIDYYRSKLNGTVNRRGHMSESDFLGMLIPCPSIEEQKHVVKTMSQAKQVMISLIEEMTALDQLIKARFVEMFGDPASKNQPWQHSNMRMVCTRITDGEHGSVPRTASGHVFLNAKHIQKSGSIDWATVSYIDDEVHQKIYKRCNPEPGDILMTTTGTIGNIAIVPDVLPFSMDRGITLLKIDSKIINPSFLAWLLRFESIQQIMTANVHASAIGHLFLNKVEQLPVLVPPLTLQQQFAAFVSQVDKSKVVEFSVFTKRAKSYII